MSQSQHGSLRVGSRGNGPAVQWASHQVPLPYAPQFQRIPAGTSGVRGGPVTVTPRPQPRQTVVQQPAVPAPRDISGDFSFNFSKAPWNLVLKQFAVQTGMSLQLTHSPAGSFTYFDERRYTASEALDILNDYLLPQGAILVRQANKLTLFGTDSKIPDGLIPFVQLRDLPRVGRNELASIAIPLQVADPANAVTEIEQLLSRVGRAQALSNSRRAIVTDTGAYLRRILDLVTGAGIAAGESQSYVYELRHAAAEEVAKAINEFYSGKAQVRDGETGGGGSQIVTAEKTTNSLIVRRQVGTDSELFNMIKQLDRAPREVLIQAVLVEVHLGNTDEFGVELGFQDSVLFDRSVIDNIVTVTETVTSTNGTQTSNDKIISQTAAPGFNFNNQPLGNNVAVSPGTIAGQGLSALGVGRVNGDLGFGGLVLSAGSENVSVLLRALSARFQLDILSRPQIRALDNHEALIQIGQQVPVVDGVSVTAVGSANPVIRQDQAGIILKVTPRISPEGKVIILVNAEKSSFQLAPGTGVPIFTDATNGNVIEAPIKDVTTANTTVSVQTGQTIVLGGMITKEDTLVHRKVPVLGDIPILGGLFRYDLNRESRRELLVFLTPHVIVSQAQADVFKQREIMRTHMLEPMTEFDSELYGIGSHAAPPVSVHPSADYRSSMTSRPLTQMAYPPQNTEWGPFGMPSLTAGHSAPVSVYDARRPPAAPYAPAGTASGRQPMVSYHNRDRVPTNRILRTSNVSAIPPPVRPARSVNPQPPVVRQRFRR